MTLVVFPILMILWFFYAFCFQGNVNDIYKRFVQAIQYGFVLVAIQLLNSF